MVGLFRIACVGVHRIRIGRGSTLVNTKRLLFDFDRESVPADEHIASRRGLDCRGLKPT
jgi:hypothetical protein